jgi:hypothetical protein
MRYKLKFFTLVFGLLFALRATIFAGVPSVEVTVFDASEKVVFKQPINADSAFATGNLRPGKYVVQFKSHSAALKNNQYLLVVSAGAKKVIATAVPGETLTDGGAAVKINVGAGLNITGQVAKELAPANADTSKSRMINGKRYVWVGPELGSNQAGHWVAEGSPPALNVGVLSADELRKKQDRGGEGSMLNGQRFEGGRHY